jgi:predicted transcriptional regulator
MQQETFTLYKLIVLYMLDQSAVPLSKSTVNAFILDKGYTNYMTLQQAIGELLDNQLITQKSDANRALLSVTAEGCDTLNYFENRISDAIKEDVKNFLIENKTQLKNDYSITSNYYKSVSGEYEAQLMAKEKDVVLMDLRISVPTQEMAEDVCLNWKKRNEEVYRMLTQMLF